MSSTKWKKLTHGFIQSKAARRQPETVEWYEDRLNHWLAFVGERKLKPKKVTVIHLDGFFAQMKAAGYKYNTRQGTATALGAFFRWLHKFGHIKRNPFDDFEPLDKERDVKEPIPLSFAQAMIRSAEAHNSIYGIRDAAIMRLLLTTGARREEVVVLPLADLDMTGSQVILTGKFNHRRQGYLKASARTALEYWLEYRPRTLDKAVFVSLHPSRKGIYHQMEPEAINDLLIKWRDIAGLPQVSVSSHKWRRRFATDVARAKNPFGLQYLLGHTDLSITSGYVFNSSIELRELVERFAPDTGESS